MAIYGHQGQAASVHIRSFVKDDPERELVVAICKALKAEREKQGISQQRLSEMAGISRTGLRHVESLETNPTLYTLLKISRSLGFRLEELIKND